MIVRAFSRLSEVAQIVPKYEMPGLHPADPLGEEKDLKSLFERLLSTAKAHPKIPDRPLLARTNLNKLAYLYFLFSCKKPEDCDVLMSAYWTYCGHNIWPYNGSLKIIVQTCINLEVPEKAVDLFLYSKQLLFIPNEKLVNRYLKSLVEKENWKLLFETYKILYVNVHIPLNEHSYIMALLACKHLKKWRWSCKFHQAGKKQLGFTKEFYEAVKEMASDLPEEEKEKFLFEMTENN